MNYYSFEHGSGATWSVNVVSADSYKLSINKDGVIRLSSVVPSSIDFTDLKNFSAIGGPQFRQIVRKTLQASLLHK